MFPCCQFEVPEGELNFPTESLKTFKMKSAQLSVLLLLRVNRGGLTSGKFYPTSARWPRVQFYSSIGQYHDAWARASQTYTRTSLPHSFRGIMFGIKRSARTTWTLDDARQDECAATGALTTLRATNIHERTLGLLSTSMDDYYYDHICTCFLNVLTTFYQLPVWITV